MVAEEVAVAEEAAEPVSVSEPAVVAEEVAVVVAPVSVPRSSNRPTRRKAKRCLLQQAQPPTCCDRGQCQLRLPLQFRKRSLRQVRLDFWSSPYNQ